MATTYVVKAGESWESIAGKLTGNQRQFLELAQANPNIYMLAPGMVINIPDVFPETPNVSVAPGSELAKAGYATSSEIEKWYSTHPTSERMPGAWSGMGGVAGAPAVGAANIPLVGQTAEGKQRGFVAPTKGGYKPGWQPAVLAPGAYTPAQQPRGVPKPLPVGQTAEGRQRQFVTGGPTLQTTPEARQRAGYATPRTPINLTAGGAYTPYQNPLAQELMPVAQQALRATPQYSYQTPRAATTPAAPGYSYTTPPPTTSAPTPVASTEQDTFTALGAVLSQAATQEQVDALYNSGMATVEDLAASGYTPTGVTPATTGGAQTGGYYLYGNPYYGGGAGPEYAPKSEWGTLIYPQIYQNASDYAETLASEPLRNSGLLMGLWNWRGHE